MRLTVFWIFPLVMLLTACGQSGPLSVPGYTTQALPVLPGMQTEEANENRCTSCAHTLHTEPGPDDIPWISEDSEVHKNMRNKPNERTPKLPLEIQGG